MSVNIGSQNDILIRTMTLEDYTKIKDILYNEEPLLLSSEKDTKDLQQQIGHKYFNDFHNLLIEQGTCLVAVNENGGGHIVGLVLAGCQVPSDLEKHRRESIEMEQNTWGRISVYLSEIEMKVNIFERYGVSKVLYSQMTYVEELARGKGLGLRLSAALMELGRSKGFPLMVASCTSFYSARQKEALGMECVYSEAYADYKDVKGEVIFKPKAPHTHIRIMAKRL